MRALGRRALPVAYHVGAWNDIDLWPRPPTREFGRIDVLVNNAGMSPLYPSVDAVTEELYDKVLDVNLKGPFRLSRSSAADGGSDGGGSIINVSRRGEVPVRPTSSLRAAKAG